METMTPQEMLEQAKADAAVGLAEVGVIAAESPLGPQKLDDWRQTFQNRRGEPFACSHFALQLFRQSPALFRNVYVTRSYEKPRTHALDFGVAFDVRALEPDRFDKVALVCDHDGRTKKGKAAALRARKEGKVLVSSDDVAAMDAMIEAICGHEIAAELLAADGRLVQQELRWTCPYTDMPMKARLDVIVASQRIAIDVKSAADPPTPADFARTAFNLGYHRQAALYMEALESEMPQPDGPWRFLHLVVCKASEHGHAVMLGELGPAELSLGHDDNRFARMDMVSCLDTDEWTRPESRGVQRLEFPRWAFNQKP